MTANNSKIAIIGLGYVGLPLAVEFGKVFDTVGFDINEKRIGQLLEGFDSTLEVEKEELRKVKKLNYTSDVEDIRRCNIFIITVPTPIDEHKNPDLAPLIKASQTVGSLLKKDDIVIYESTVYPGATEEVCVPILAQQSALVFNEDFFCGYSPERINPGDKLHRIKDIKKVTSGSTPNIADQVDLLYGSIITAGTHKAGSIKIAEASKVIENTQRDINIALINELAMIFKALDIDTEAVLEAASTKWNFLSFKPGLVGGHCIGVDPYYLTYKAIASGYRPEMILAGRSLNDNMASYVVNQIFCLMSERQIEIKDANILLMGLTFKENCPDLRNSQVINMVTEFKTMNCHVDVFDPWLDADIVQDMPDIRLVDEPVKGEYDAIVMAVAHDEFKILDIEQLHSYGKSNHIIYDIKYIFNVNDVDGRL
jgi:UDP-N-acetyl-D-glucosamine/UDP-N-acetyl-D-galactosamine dehydrogenase